MDNIECSVYKIMFTAWENLESAPGKQRSVFKKKRNENPGAEGKHNAT